VAVADKVWTGAKQLGLVGVEGDAKLKTWIQEMEAKDQAGKVEKEKTKSGKK
jgi:hypothetical protein